MAQANKDVQMSSLSYNLKKYLRFILRKIDVLVQILILEERKRLSYLNHYLLLILFLAYTVTIIAL